MMFRLTTARLIQIKCEISAIREELALLEDDSALYIVEEINKCIENLDHAIELLQDKSNGLNIGKFLEILKPVAEILQLLCRIFL